MLLPTCTIPEQVFAGKALSLHKSLMRLPFIGDNRRSEEGDSIDDVNVPSRAGNPELCGIGWAPGCGIHAEVHLMLHCSGFPASAGMSACPCSFSPHFCQALQSWTLEELGKMRWLRCSREELGAESSRSSVSLKLPCQSGLNHLPYLSKDTLTATLGVLFPSQRAAEGL